MNAPPLAVLVLAAGFGRRLEPLTLERPKPLLPVGDRPLLQAQLENLLELSVGQLWVNAHYRAVEIDSFIKGLDFTVHVSHEQEILGTAGGAARVAQAASVERLLLLNGDIWGQWPIQEFIDGLPAESTQGLTLAVRPRPPGEGTVGLDAQGGVVRLRGEVHGTEVRSGDYFGLALLGRDCLLGLPPQGCLVGDWALPQLRSGSADRIRAVELDAHFVDIGTPSSYLTANLAWLTERGIDSYVGEGARCATSIELRRSVLGPGARVTGRGLLERSLVLPGAELHLDSTHPLVGAIVTRRHGILTGVL